MRVNMTRTSRAARQRLFLAAALLLLAAACSGTKEDKYVERPVEDLYNRSMSTLSTGEYIRAAKEFDEVDRQHPYSVWATKAKLMAAYSYYQATKYDDAILAAERFKQLHPGNKDAPYAYYLVAISYYEQIVDVARDQRNTELALKSLEEVVRRFPTTEYARDARLKLDLARDHLAGKEMTIGRYYQGQKQYIAAINRYRNVVDNYQTTTHVAEALHRLVECYSALGVHDEAEKVAAVLGHNYPGSDWYADSYYLLTGKDFRSQEEKAGWFSRNLSRIF
jgi:outer membrane protein assembly factor BamD